MESTVDNTTFSEEKVFDEEGCLSFKGIFVKVERPKVIEIEYETTQGTKQTTKLNQHGIQVFPA